MHLLKHTLLACTAGAMLALPIDLALAESTYGYAASPFATDASVSATDPAQAPDTSSRETNLLKMLFIMFTSS